MTVVTADPFSGDASENIENKAEAKKSILVYGMNYSPEFAGVGKYTGELAEHFASQKMDVTVVTTPPHYPGWKVKEGYRNRFSKADENGICVIRNPLILRERMSGIWRLIAPLSFALTSAPIVFWQILRRRPDVVFCVEPTLFASPIALLAAKISGSRIVLHVQDLEVDAAFSVGHLASRDWLKKIGFAFERFTLARFDKVITISNRMAEKLVDKGVWSQRIAIVRNWVDLSHIYPMDQPSHYREDLGFGPTDFVVLYSGNIGAKQGLQVLLDAAECVAGNSAIHFVIAGEGPAKSELISRYGSLPNVRFLPFQPYEKLNEFLNMADLHVLPQDRGAADLVLPSKLGGMLASGKPVLVTADPGTELAEFLDGAAILTAPGDVEALAKGIVAAAKAGSDTAMAERASACAQTLSREDGLAALQANL